MQYGLTCTYFCSLSSSGVSLFLLGGEPISPCVSKMTGYLETPVPTPIFTETRPGRICATPLRMAELAETREDYNFYGANTEGVGGLGVGLRTPGVLDHTTVPICSITITITFEAIDQTVLGTSLDCGIEDCRCCGVVGMETRSKKSKSKASAVFVVMNM